MFHTVTEAMLKNLFKKSVNLPLSLFLLATAESSGPCFFDLLQGRGCSQCQAAECQTLRLHKLCAAGLLRRGHQPLSRKRSLSSLCGYKAFSLCALVILLVHVLLRESPCPYAAPDYEVTFQTRLLQTHPSLCLSCLIFRHVLCLNC